MCAAITQSLRVIILAPRPHFRGLQNAILNLETTLSQGDRHELSRYTRFQNPAISGLIFSISVVNSDVSCDFLK